MQAVNMWGHLLSVDMFNEQKQNFNTVSEINSIHSEQQQLFSELHKNFKLIGLEYSSFYITPAGSKQDSMFQFLTINNNRFKFPIFFNFHSLLSILNNSGK